MPPKKGKGRAKRSYPDAEEVAAKGHVNVHAYIHPVPPEEDMPAEAVQPPAEVSSPLSFVVSASDECSCCSSTQLLLLL